MNFHSCILVVNRVVKSFFKIEVKWETLFLFDILILNIHIDYEKLNFLDGKYIILINNKFNEKTKIISIKIYI